MIKHLECDDIELFTITWPHHLCYRPIWLQCAEYPSYCWVEGGKPLVMGGGVPVSADGVALWSVYLPGLPSLKLVRALKAGFGLMCEAFQGVKYFESYVRQGEEGHMKFNKRLGFTEAGLVYGLEPDGTASIRMVRYMVRSADQLTESVTSGLWSAPVALFTQ
jgi:hypothetical protein